MSLVVDASLSLAWYFEDERTPTIDAVLDEVVGTGAVVPSLSRLEVVNGLQMAVRRKRIDSLYRDRALQQLGFLPTTTDGQTDAFAWSTRLQLADRFGLTIYGAAYVELAQRRTLPLATLDGALQRAAQVLGVPLAGGDA